MGRELLIVADKTGKDKYAVQDYDLDLAYGSGENDFQLSFEKYKLDGQEIIYLDGTGYGGIVDSIEFDTDVRLPIYRGRTWQGIMNSCVIEPPYNQAYLTVRGEPNAILRDLLNSQLSSLKSLFAVENVNTGYEIEHTFARYVKGYDAINDMLMSHGLKLVFTVKQHKVYIQAKPSQIITSVDSDLMDFKIEQFKNKTNHLICLGKGELTERTVIHLYSDKDGNISKSQSIYGIDEYTDIYDYSSAESTEELEKYGIKRLKELRDEGKVEIDIVKKGDWEVGDVVKATEVHTGLEVESKIRKKIIKSIDGYTEVSFDVGEDK